MISNMHKNILFLHAGAEMYGADKILLELLSSLNVKQFNSYVILPNDGPLVRAINDLGIKVKVLELGVLRRKYYNVIGLFNRIYFISRAIYFLRKFVKEKHIDIIHTNTSTVLVGGIIAKMMNIPHVWHIHEITKTPKILHKTLSYIIPTLATSVVTVSNAVKSNLVDGCSKNKDKCIVIYNGITTDDYVKAYNKTIRNKFNIKENDILVGMIGRVNRWKGQNKFIDVSRIVLNNNKNVKFMLVGGTFDGEERLFDMLIDRVQCEGLENHVFIENFRTDIPAVLAAFDIFVLPSTEPDPLPTVVLEAMASSKAVISFAHGGANEMVIDGYTGMLVPVLDEKAMADAILDLSHDSLKRNEYGNNGRNRCLKHFTKESFSKNFESLYTTLLARNLKPESMTLPPLGRAKARQPNKR